MSQVPDEIIFGRDLSENTITYGEVRKITDETVLIGLLENRLIHYFIQQVEPLKASRSAFPLATLTCVGIETLGEIFITPDKDDTSFQFISVLKKLNQTFGRKPNQKYQAKLEAIWTEKDLKNINSYGKIIYRFFRNTMIHGFQAKGMFLSYEDTKTITIDDASAFIVINPDWFWEIFKAFFYKQFDLVKKSQENSSERITCLNYINTFLLV